MLVILLSLSMTKKEEKEESLIRKWLFDEIRLVVIRLPFAPRNQEFSKRFISILQTFANAEFRFNIIWNTRKIHSLFDNKDKVQHLSCVICKSVCSCGAYYIGETIRNVKIRQMSMKVELMKIHNVLNTYKYIRVMIFSGQYYQ